MKLLNPSTFLFALIVACTPLRAADNLVPSGDFETDGPLPEQWEGHKAPHLDRIAGSHDVVTEDGVTFLRLTKENPDSAMQVKTTMDLPGGTRQVSLDIRSRVPAVQPGEENPGRNRFRAGVSFHDATGKKVGEGNPQIAYGEPVPDWKSDSATYDVPEGAVKMELGFSLLSCTGIWEIDSVTVTPAK